MAQFQAIKGIEPLLSSVELRHWDERENAGLNVVVVCLSVQKQSKVVTRLYYSAVTKLCLDYSDSQF